jgi:membrane protein YdbS with pleckstrin-like domain
MEQDKLLEDGEILLEGVRKHWIVYLSDSIIHILGCGLFIGIAGYLSMKGVIPFLSADNKAYIVMILVFFVIIFWTSFFYFWTKNYFDVWYVTDRHIIAVDQKDIFIRNESFMELVKIQDVSFEKNGFLSTFLGYGRLKVQTAGSDQEFVIEDVADVEAVAHRIMELRDAKKQV